MDYVVNQAIKILEQDSQNNPEHAEHLRVKLHKESQAIMRLVQALGEDDKVVADVIKSEIKRRSSIKKTLETELLDRPIVVTPVFTNGKKSLA